MVERSATVTTGRVGKKFVDRFGCECEVTPFVGFLGEEPAAKFGAGVHIKTQSGTESFLWGRVIPRELIAAWRGMKLLEEIPAIHLDRTIASCVYAGQEAIFPGDDTYLDELGALFGGYEKFREIRARVLLFIPASEELQGMLSICEEHALEVDREEIERERRKGDTFEEIMHRLCKVDERRWKAKKTTSWRSRLFG